MRLSPGKAAGDHSGIAAGAFSWASLPTKDKIQVCASSQPGQAEVLHPRAALGELFPLREKAWGGGNDEARSRRMFPEPGFS